jgi:folylpolyglutamate synthase/dihydropteroate synthase
MPTCSGRASTSDGKLAASARAIIAPLLPLCARIIATAPPSPRALPAAELAALVPGAQAIAAPTDAIAAARAEGGVTLLAGSIFLVGAARAIVLGEPADTLPVQDPLKRM